MATTWTLPRQIEQWAAERPQRKALIEKGADGNWNATTWAEYWQAVRDLAKGLIELGLAPGQSALLVGANRRDWVISQFGVSAASGVPAPIYATNTVDQVAHIANNCEAPIAICDDETQVAKFLGARSRGLIKLDHVITMDAIGSDSDIVISLSDVIARGRAASDQELDRRLAAVNPEDLALLIYTSGTTGVPKGAMYTHAGIDAISKSAIETYPELQEIDPARYISYLPLCHAAEQCFTNFLSLRNGAETYFCPEITDIKDYLIAARPHLFFAVPRVWEKFEAALASNFAQATGGKAKLLNWARGVELRSFERGLETGRPVNPISRRIANKLVFSKVRGALGLDQLIGAGSGAAPISNSTLNFFASIGIPIHEGYGMTETTGMATGQPLGRPRFGTVGQALPGVEIKIASDGEILLRGSNMIQGYLRMPEQTAELYAEPGWLSTGDLGELDKDGFLRITGRKKDLLITAGGKNVAPAEMENHLQGIPGVGQAVVVGDRQPYLCALLVLDEEALPDLFRAAGVPTMSLAEAAKDERIRAFLEKRVEQDCNTKVARYQTIKKFEVMPTVFSVEGGELTPTMKVKRNVVNEKYASIIDRLYEGGTLAAQASRQPRA